MKIHESAENYLETIFILSRKDRGVRSIDIAGMLDFSKASVSVAMRNLREGGYINVNTDGYITLTESGLEIAERIYERHTLISGWLMSLGIDKETALEDACKIEHVISAKSFDAIKKFAKNS